MGTQGRSIAGIGLAIGVALILEGCAYGQTYRYDDVTLQLASAPTRGSVAVGVHDLRPYVVSGGKPEKFVGLMRGGFGNPFDVNTETGGPLAIEMRDAIAKGLRAKGLTVLPVVVNPSDGAAGVKSKLAASGAPRLLLVTLDEWKSDTMMNTALIYNVSLAVLDAKGETLAINRSVGRDNLGSLGLSPGPGITAGFVRRFEALFDDPKIAAAMR